MDKQHWIGKPLTAVGRVADMLWLAIGQKTIAKSFITEEKRMVSELAIHFQCQWRFVQKRKILVASHDLYEPYDPQLLNDESWDWDIVARNKAQSSQFDVCIADLNQNLLPLIVIDFVIHDTGDLHITFDKDIHLDTFITSSRKDEFYRFIDFNTGEHFVIFDEI